MDDLSLRVERGQILGLLVSNGAVKTTTLRALMGLLHPDAGTITIFGRRVHPGSPALSRLGSFVEGPGFLPHLSGRANLELYWRATGRPAGWHLDEVLAIAGLGAAIDRPVRTYSRGMCQRLAIAQAMLGLPDLLVLDEPMNGLDPPQIREMRDALLRYAAEGRTVILSSHLLAEVEQTCGHVVVMNQGRRIAAGPVADIVGDGAALLIGTTQADRAVSVLRDLAGIDSVDRHADGVQVQPNGVPPSAVVAALVGAGIPVDRVGPSRRLEDAFLALIDNPSEEAGSAKRRRPLLRVLPVHTLAAHAAAAGGGDPPARRRRTMVAALILLALPWILVGAFELGGPPQPGSGAPGLVDLATTGGLNFAAFSFFASVGFLLVVAVALFCGDTVASEAGWGTLRYLLAAPVPRARLLRQKLVVALAYSAVAVTSFPLMSLAAGTVAFGWHPLRLPGTGAVLGSGVAVGRMGIVLVYVLGTELVVAGLAFLLSVSTDSPLGAVGGAVGLVIVSDILDAVTALGGWRQVLPTHWQFAWLDAMQPQISWGGMLEGAAVSLSYALVLFALAFRHFRAKDIVS